MILLNNEKNVVLGGFMGFGKTTLGKALALRLGRRFVDLDDHIAAAAGMSIPEIFAQQGEEAFRDLEHAALRKLAGERGLVLATGGGAMASARNVALLRQSGVVLYLNPGFAVCCRRIRDSDRPLVTANTPEGLERIYLERQAVYRKAAHLELNTAMPLEQCVEAAVRLLGF